MTENDTNDYKSSRRDELKKKGLFTCLWILVLLVIFMVFLIKRETIKENLISTGFFEKLFGKTPTFLENPNKVSQKEKELLNQPVVTKKETEKPDSVEYFKMDKLRGSPTIQVDPVKTKQEAPEPSLEKPEPEVIAENPPEEAKAPEPEAKDKIHGPSQSAKLFFVKIDTNGTVSRLEVSRTVLKNDSPLTTSIQLLIAGPDASEKVLGCSSLIPEDSKLLGATVKDRTAYLNFNEEFMFNQEGTEGLLAQLMQVVYTATEFSTVDNVQILINGTKQNYLGLEGVWIGSPLSRTSFK
ncbi:MAG: GerMN domain-containing protein [Treponema sp.]|nr:GerMN domain-containing protein [Treponema sp.]